MADNSLNNIDVFNDKDFLDVAVEGYEENVPLLGQIGIGVTPVGVGIDIAEATKYGRQGLGELSAGLGALSSPFQWHKSGPLLSSGAKHLGIAGLATIGAIPVLGDIAQKLGKRKIKQLMTPKVGKPVYEAPLRKKGPEVETEADILFNQHQAHIKSADELSDSAKRINPEFQDEIESIAKEKGYRTTTTPGEPITDPEIIKHLDPNSATPIDVRTGNYPGTVKLKPRIIEKANQKYSGDVSQITDPIRTQVIVETTQEADDMAEALAKRYAVKDSGNQVNLFGYRDRKVNIQFIGSNGEKLVAEVSMMSTPMHKAATESHEFFKPWRSISNQYKDVDKMPRDIYFEWKNLKGKQQYIFNKAYEFVDSSWQADDIIKKFAFGGAVYGSSGSVSPMTPNVFSNSSLVSNPPFSPISPYCPPDALTQSEPPTGIKKALVTPSSGKSPIIAGPRSQDKYESSAINNSITKKFVDLPTEGGRKEIL